MGRNLISMDFNFKNKYIPFGVIGLIFAIMVF